MQLFSVLVLSLFAAVSANAEQFSLTRQDGRVFVCTDNGGVTVPPVVVPPTSTSITSCDCNDDGGNSYGRVLGDNLQAQCKKTVDNQYRKALLNNCGSLSVPIGSAGVQCNCGDNAGNSYGVVFRDVTSASDLTDDCRSIVDNIYRKPILSACKAM